MNDNLKNKMILEKLVTDIWSKLGTAEQNQMIPYSCERLKQYEVVVGMPTFGKYPKTNFIGYPVQVRKDVGAFGSDVVLIREFDGELSTWENQGYLLLTKEELEIATPIFEKLISDDKENWENGFTINGNNREIGYIIEKSEYESTPVAPISITTLENGKISSQIVITG